MTTPSDVSHLYYVEEFELIHVLPEDKEFGDTIDIKVSRADLLVDLTYFQMDMFSYPMKAGDTMVVKYVKGIPRVKLINRSYPKYDFAYDSLRMNYLNHNKIDMNEMIMTKDIKQNYQSFLASRKSLYERETRLLDSLHKNGLVSDYYNDIVKEKIRYKFLNLTTSLGLTRNIDNLPAHYNKADLNKAGLLDFSFYRLFLLQYVYNVLNDGQGFRSSNGFTQDSRKAFDSIVIDPNIENNKVRDLLLKNTLTEIRKNFSEEDGEIYYNKFLNKVADTSLIKKFNEKFLLNLRNDNNVREVLLLGANQKPISLDSLLIKNRNKVAYIDFWASWCVPCIKEMPASKQLQNDYQEKDVEFIYISIDHDSQKWERSYNNLNLGVGENNLITLNYPAAQFIKTCL